MEETRDRSQEDLDNIEKVFSTSQIYHNLLERSTPGEAVSRLMNDRDFAKLAGIKYKNLNSLSIRTAILNHKRKTG